MERNPRRWVPFLQSWPDPVRRQGTGTLANPRSLSLPNVTEPQAARALATELSVRVDERPFGIESPLKLVMIGIVTGSHVLIDDVPDVGKTTLVRMLATLLGLSFQRVQFTPDLTPTDITGTSVPDMRTNDFAFRPGPLSAQVVLADEINGARPVAARRPGLRPARRAYQDVRYGSANLDRTGRDTSRAGCAPPEDHRGASASCAETDQRGVE